MDVTEIERLIQSKLVIIAGGRDKEGKPLIFVNPPPSTIEQAAGVSSAPNPGNNPSPEKSTLHKALQYALNIFNGDTRNNGLTVLFDARQSSWRQTRYCVRLLNNSLKDDNVTLIVIRPEAFWDKRVDNCTRLYKNSEPIYVPLSRLNKCVEQSQLTEDIEGTLTYNHNHWLQSRLRIERFFKMNAEVQTELERVYKILAGAKEGFNNAARTMTQTSATYNNTCQLANLLLNDGRNLLDSYGVDRITEIIGQDVLDTRSKVEKQISLAQSRLTALHQAWQNLIKSISDAKEVSRLEFGVKSVTDWLLETGDALLTANKQVGYDILSAEHLRIEHEALELQCTETYGHYAELLHQIDQSLENGVAIPDDLKAQKDFMDFICRSFATRLERRRNTLITSARFFRLVSEYFQLTSEVYENLVMSPDLSKLDQANPTLRQLQECQENIEHLEEALVREGEKLCDFLAMPVKDALGRDILVDYEADIVNIKEILDMTKARSELFRDSVELQRITLQQASHVYEYEKDATQAIVWLEDIFQVMLKHLYVGCNVLEIQRQKEDHQMFQDTAKGTYEYGCQLLNAALSLRQYSKLGDGGNLELSIRLSETWEKFQIIAHHHMTRLRVTAVLHRTLNQQCIELKELTYSAQIIKDDSLKKLLQSREKLLIEVARMLRLARLLRTRLRDPFPLEIEMMDDNRNAVEAISERVAEVTLLAERLDAVLCSQSEFETAAQLAHLQRSQSPSSKLEDWCVRSDKSGSASNKEDTCSQDEFATASECTCTPPSRSSSFYTASEGENYPWWLHDDTEAQAEGVECGLITQTVSEELKHTRTLKLSPDGCTVTTDINQNQHVISRSSSTTPIQNRFKDSARSSTPLTNQTDRYTIVNEKISPINIHNVNERTTPLHFRESSASTTTSTTISNEQLLDNLTQASTSDPAAIYHDITKRALTGIF